MDDARVERREGASLFALLCVFNLLNYIDRAAITGLLDPIRHDLRATDAQMGVVGFAFLATYATLPLVFGILADRMSRTSLLAASAAFWSLATAVTGLARRVWQLVGMRGAVGVGEASYMATSPSVIMDLFAPATRGRAMSIFYIASPVGSAVGVALGGLLVGPFGWRGACLIVGLPGLIAAAVMARHRDPPRGRFDVEAPPPIHRSIGVVLVELLVNRVYVLLILGYGAMVFTQNAIEYWLPTVLQRDKGIPITHANAAYGGAVLLAGVFGPLTGVAVADWLRRHDARAYFHVSSIVGLLLVVPLLGIGLSTGRTPILASVFGEAFIGNASIGIILTLIVGVVAPEIRATATAVALTSVHVLGDIISIPLVGKISTVLQGLSVSDRIWERFRAFGIGPDEHLVLALVAVTIPGALAAALMFQVASRAAGPEVARAAGA